MRKGLSFIIFSCLASAVFAVPTSAPNTSTSMGVQQNSVGVNTQTRTNGMSGSTATGMSMQKTTPNAANTHSSDRMYMHDTIHNNASTNGTAAAGMSGRSDARGQTPMGSMNNSSSSTSMDANGSVTTNPSDTTSSVTTNAGMQR